MVPKLTKTTYFEIDYKELEKLVNEVYGFKGRDYSFVACQEAMNDSAHTFDDVTGKVRDGLEEEDWDIFLKTGYNIFVNHLILEDLVSKGHLEKGNYIVSVCW